MVVSQMRKPQSFATSENDPSSPYVSASTICLKLLETQLTEREQLAQSYETENSEFVRANVYRIDGSETQLASWLKLLAAIANGSSVNHNQSADFADTRSVSETPATLGRRGTCPVNWLIARCDLQRCDLHWQPGEKLRCRKKRATEKH